MRRHVAATGLLVVAAGCTGEPPEARPADAPVAVLALRPYVAGLLTVDVAVGEGTLPFIVDTGGGVTVVTPAVAEAVGCSPFGRGVGFRHDGERVEMERCSPVALEIGGWSGGAREVAVWDLAAVIPKELPTLGGLVSLDSFDGLAVTFDLGHERVVVEGSGSLAHRIEGGAEVPIRAAHQVAGASLDVFLAVQAEPGPLWFELDSGNAGPVRIAPHAAAMLGLELSETEASEVSLPLPGYGPVTVQAVLREGMIYDGLLNADFLRERVVTLDLAAERAWIARSRHPLPER